MFVLIINRNFVIANVCNEAALHAARVNKECVMESDLEYAVERSVGKSDFN